MGKQPWKSKTIWVNLAVVVVVAILDHTPRVSQMVCRDPEVTAALATALIQGLACLNLYLRAVTSEPLRG